MSHNTEEIFVLVPYSDHGFTIASVADLDRTFSDPDNDERSFDDVLGDTGIDSPFGGDQSAVTNMERVRRLNATGDARTFHEES